MPVLEKPICRCGSIDHSTEQGIFTSGVFYECIHQGFPFSLAGSNRNDGPYPIRRWSSSRLKQSTLN